MPMLKMHDIFSAMFAGVMWCVNLESHIGFRKHNLSADG